VILFYLPNIGEKMINEMKNELEGIQKRLETKFGKATD
jgi:hypothetical protein